ncbi:hypothetical protein LJR153_007269 [Paenibacillus sp. LjRoot153]|uniref:hypothetical protein n=1 Tax=Paenibacillus sp. LjRoot153 TaxID=3342270 RepID=UPI003ECFCA70
MVEMIGPNGKLDMNDPICGAIYQFTNVNLYNDSTLIPKSNDNYYLHGIPMMLTCGICEHDQLTLKCGDQTPFSFDTANGIKINGLILSYEEMYLF